MVVLSVGPMELVSGKNLNKGNDFSLGDFGVGW